MNELGNLFKVLSFGESHGPYVGCVITGCPAGLLLDMEKIQSAVNRRKTNQNFFTSSRNESDKVEIISGVFEESTTGASICILVKNEDVRSADYDELKNIFRPGHADFTYYAKYGIRDHRGGGRSSIRVTAPLVAAGEIARQLLSKYFNYEAIAYVSQIGSVQIPDLENIDQTIINESPIRCPHKESETSMLDLIEITHKQGDTLGGVISCTIKNLPAGIGEPIFGKLQAQLAHAMMNINTVKSFEYGEGMKSASMKGSEHNDVFINEDEKIKTISNHHGGILGGISTGMDINFKVYFKPISSIKKEQKTINQELKETTIQIKGRHDVCAVPRAVPIVEAYTHITLADLFLQSKTSKI